MQRGAYSVVDVTQAIVLRLLATFDGFPASSLEGELFAKAVVQNRLTHESIPVRAIPDLSTPVLVGILRVDLPHSMNPITRGCLLEELLRNLGGATPGT